ncbi:phage gene 29 protein family protein [Mycolicibacterium nivoides]|uniref:phage gene 29 protein family protein n=1 Tax=Mycolicibacterium nivoides TaxID=2487344 RepID=UPI000F5BC4F6
MLSQNDCDMENPEQFAAWAFAAGVPDPRGERYPNQPLIPAKCFGGLSQMLWDFGFRWHEDKQTKWVSPRTGPTRNFEAWGTTDIKPEDILDDVAQMAVEEFPQIAAKVAAVTPEKHQEALEEATKDLLSKIERLNEARSRMESRLAEREDREVTPEAEAVDGGST